MREFLRIAGINIYDVLQENFDNPLLKGALSLDGVLGTNLGPAPTTVCSVHYTVSAAYRAWPCPRAAWAQSARPWRR